MKRGKRKVKREFEGASRRLKWSSNVCIGGIHNRVQWSVEVHFANFTGVRNGWLLAPAIDHFLLALKTGLMCCQLKLQPMSLHQKLKTQGVQQPVFSKLFRVKPLYNSFLGGRTQGLRSWRREFIFKGQEACLKIRASKITRKNRLFLPILRLILSYFYHYPVSCLHKNVRWEQGKLCLSLT